ncbi:ABC transporter ATP-binding protein [Patescibacteria group bacterium]
MKKNTVIKTQNLTKYYGKTLGCKNLSFSVEEGEIFGFLGPNGAGKTTTIRLLLDLIRPTKGGAKIFGKDIYKDSVEIKENTGNLPGDTNMYRKMTGINFLKYMERFRKNNRSNYKLELASKLDLDLKRKIKNYSKGNRQKLGIVQTLMNKPKLIIFDEPTNGLDPLVQQKFYKIILELKKKGHTIFFSSHVLSEVEKICDRVGIIRKGELAAIKSITELRKEKVHYLRVMFKEKVKPEEFEKLKGVTKVEEENKHLVITYKGNINALIKKLAKYTILDLSFKEMDLESVFLDYYK